MKLSRYYVAMEEVRLRCAFCVLHGAPIDAIGALARHKAS